MVVWFAFQRSHKNYGFPVGPNAPEDGKEYGNAGEWSHFYLLFLHLYSSRLIVSSSDSSAGDGNPAATFPIDSATKY